MRWALAVFACLWAGAVCAQDEITFEFDTLNAEPRWPAFDADQIACLFDADELRRQTVPTRFGNDTASAVIWSDGDADLIVFEAIDYPNNPGVFSIWTEHARVVGPNGWRVGVTTLAEVQAEWGTCGRGFTRAADRAICSFNDDAGFAGSLVFKDLHGGPDLAANGALAPEWGSTPLSRIERYRGAAPRARSDCRFLGS